MDMGAGAAFESMKLGAAVVGVLCVLPMFVLLVVVVITFWPRKRND
jgi:hypothetical protein